MSSTDQTIIPITNVEELKFTEHGIILPEESEILDGVIQDFQHAFNNKLQFYNAKDEFLLSTPQGQLVSSIAAIISDRNRLLAFYVNQVDPNYAVGRMQDAIGRIYFIERIQASSTVVVGMCRGVEGTVIPALTMVRDTQGNLYKSQSDYTITTQIYEADGTLQSYVNIPFVCETKGPISCPANTLTQRYQVIQGWESVTNPLPGEVGNNVESQAQFEQRRRQSVAGNAVNSVDSIMAALLNLTVTVNRKKNKVCQDAYVTENSLSEEHKIGNITLKAHSIYVCVVAADTTENKKLIAQTIWNKKPPGCDMNGEITVKITDDTKDEQGQSLYANPPTYDICYSYAKNVSIQFNIEMTRSPNAPKDATDQIKKAVVDAFTGTRFC